MIIIRFKALSPEGCSSYTFPRLMGPIKANEILLFNKKLTAQEALERNLVNLIIADADFQTKSWKLVEEYSKNSESSLILAKNLIRKHEIDKLMKVNELEKKLLGDRLKSGEFLNYVMNFVNKKAKL
jgi:peroxisomal 3,2-trans-enoyl-CoA isomerase